MKKKSWLRYPLLSFLFLIVGITSSAVATEPSMNTYTSYPPFLTSTVKPAVMVILDTSDSMLKFAYASSYDPNTTYDGYFDSTAEYSYNSTQNYFYTPKASSDTTKGVNYWEGSFLNWATMRRMDIAKNVLTGGRTYTAGDGTLCLLGQPYPEDCGWSGGFEQNRTVNYAGTGSKNYYHYHNYSDTPYFRIGGAAQHYYVRVKTTGTPKGIIQQNGQFVNFGLAIYGPDAAGGDFYYADQGGKVLNPVGDSSSSIVTNINSQDMVSTNPAGRSTFTPMAESLYTVVGYLGQESFTNINAGPKYHGADYTVSNAWDPYYSASGDVECVKSSVILISDGEANQDWSLPTFLEGSIGVTGSNAYLDDVAYWAHTSDIRSGSSGSPTASSFGKAVDGTQTVTIYTVSTFGGGSALLNSAAKYGGFIDSNGNNLPDLASEWDSDGDGDANTFFSADNSSELTNALNKALVSIMDNTAAGSAVSVLSTTSEGEAIVLQAYFKPKISVLSSDDVSWVGYVQALWVDEYGNMREDTVHDRKLDITQDRMINFFTNSAGDTKVDVFTVNSTSPYPDMATATPAATLDVEQITPLWEAGKVLSDMASPAGASLANRNIYSFIDTNDNKVVDTSEFGKFSVANSVYIKPYLGVKDNSAGDWDYLGAGSTATAHNNRATNIVKFILGYNTGFSGTTDIRSRKVGENSGSDVIWPLGDTVNATPVSISSPSDNYGIIYRDQSYQDYYNMYKDRETVVYVGANDGMLHAFTSWQYDSATKTFIKPAGASESSIGTELWAYVPQAVLPHLKWLPSKNYTHVYYVDQKVRIVDAKIFTPDAYHPNGWGTLLIAGLNLGGKNIDVVDDFDYDTSTTDSTRSFASSYFAIDITKPRDPQLLWERDYGQLGLTTSRPAVIKVKDKWFAVFGSGPTDYEGNSSNTGHIYIVDLATGDPYSSLSSDWLYDTAVTKAFMGSPASVDMGLNYNVDAVYIGETNCPGDCSATGADTWGGKLYKITIPWTGTSTGTTFGDIVNGVYDDDPKNWSAFSLFTAAGPISSPPALSVDELDNLWIYFGTGRYWNDDDKINSDTQYLYGIKDPFFNARYDSSGGAYHNYSYTTPVTSLLNSDDYAVLSTGSVVTDTSGSWVHFKPFDNGTSTDFLSYAQDNFDGWKRTLPSTRERSLTKPVLLGGVVFSTTFVPNDDVCGYGGDSYLYGLYYETGTAFTHAVFDDGGSSIAYTDGGGTAQAGTRNSESVFLGSGVSSSIGIHAGKQEGAVGLIQMGSGAILSESLTSALTFKSGLKFWIEK